jgi:hypothetical protein
VPVRTTSELVEEILEVEVDSDVSLDPFILAASSLVDQVEQYYIDKSIAEPSVGMSHSERLSLIETWLAAHFYSIRFPRTTQERVGNVMEMYENKVDYGLRLTRYGQQAVILDTTGVLNSISVTGSLKKARVYWLGTETS